MGVGNISSLIRDNREIIHIDTEKNNLGIIPVQEKYVKNLKKQDKIKYDIRNRNRGILITAKYFQLEKEFKKKLIEDQQFQKKIQNNRIIVQLNTYRKQKEGLEYLNNQYKMIKQGY